LEVEIHSIFIFLLMNLFQLVLFGKRKIEYIFNLRIVAGLIVVIGEIWGRLNIFLI